MRYSFGVAPKITSENDRLYQGFLEELIVFRQTSSGESDVTQNLHSLYFDFSLSFTFYYTDGKFTLVPTSDGLDMFFFNKPEQLVSTFAYWVCSR